MKLIGICTYKKDADRYARTEPGSVVTEYTRKDGSKYYTITKP